MMKQYVQFVKGLLGVLFLWGASLNADAREFEMSRLHVDIALQKDGSMQVMENREFTFRGSFTEVFRTFPRDGKATFNNFRVLEDGNPFTYDTTMEPGTFFVDEKGNVDEVRIFFRATDTTRTFTIGFDAIGATEKYEDAVLFYYQIISDEWTQPIYEISATVKPPVPLDNDQPAHWVHGSLDAFSQLVGEGVVEIQLDRLPSRRFLELRALYPVEAFPDMATLPGQISDEVFAEAEQLVEEANRQRLEAIEQEKRRAERHETGRRMALPISLIILSVWIFLYRRFTRKPNIENKEQVFQQMPQKERPALVSYLVFQTQIHPNAMVATLFDLAYRKVITVKEEPIGKPAKPGKKQRTDVAFQLNPEEYKSQKDALLPYEQKLLQFLFFGLNGGQSSVSLRMLARKRIEMRKFFAEWSKELKNEAKKREWYDEESGRGRNIAAVTSLLILLLMVAGVGYFGPYMMLPLALSGAFLLGSLFLYQRTEKGEIAYRQWKNLRKLMKKRDFIKGAQTPDLSTINEYLIYGVAMALGTKYFREIFRHLESTGNENYIYWMLFFNPHNRDFSRTMERVISSTSSSMSTSSGAGGGGTMGGGGGASSGGGGAR